MRRNRQAGFTLIELLVVVAIIAVIASIAIMNYLSSLDRARQKRTMADIRSIAQAWESYHSEKGSFSTAGMTFPTAVTHDDITAALAPTYMRHIPKNDGWGRPLQFGAEGKLYAIRSSARDGKYEGDDYDDGAGENPDCDIVYSNGNFVRFPEIIQKD